MNFLKRLSRSTKIISTISITGAIGFAIYSHLVYRSCLGKEIYHNLQYYPQGAEAVCRNPGYFVAFFGLCFGVMLSATVSLAKRKTRAIKVLAILSLIGAGGVFGLGSISTIICNQGSSFFQADPCGEFMLFYGLVGPPIILLGGLTLILLVYLGLKGLAFLRNRS